MPLVATARYIFQKLEKFFIYRVLSLDDTPHRIALGVAVAIFWTWTPTYGLQMILTVFLSWLLGANKFVGLPFVWISNPLTVLPVYGPNLVIGRWILGKPIGDFSALVNAMQMGGSLIDKILDTWRALLPIFWELWLGSLIVGPLLAVISYFAVYRMVVVYRTRRQHKLAHHLHEKQQDDAGRKDS
jgi:hypothetical protein